MAEYTDPQFWPQLKDLASRIDTLDYYQILNIAQTATSAEIRKSYYQFARALHPDKFFALPDEELKVAVHKIYKRITESYTILKDETRRKTYTENINGPERMTKLRYDEQSEQKLKETKRKQAAVAQTPQGEKMFKAAQADMQAQRWDKALKNIQSALLFEPANEKLKELKAELEAKAKGG
jgi:DnaJ-class molecular chaperone